MITKLIAALIIVMFIFGVYELYSYYKSVEAESQAKEQAVANRKVEGNRLPGMNYELQNSLSAAQAEGPKAFGIWLATYEHTLQDPRRAWIELDYVVAISREDPATARKIFAAVRDRTPHSSPVYPRILELAKSYQ